MGDVFYLRDAGSDLPVPVQILPSGASRKGGCIYQVQIQGVVRSFPSARQLLTTLAFNGTDRHWTLDRYRSRPRPRGGSGEPTLPILEALAQYAQSVSPMVTASGQMLNCLDPPVPKTRPSSEQEPEPRDSTGLAESTLLLDSTKGLVLDPCGSTDALTSGIGALISGIGMPPEGLGIDLAKRGHEVAKLLYAGFGSRMYSSGYDPEDVLQEVYKGILTRNRGRSAFDARKSSFGHYVHMVCSCILSNYHRKVSRTRSNEVQELDREDMGSSTCSSQEHVSDVFGSSEHLVQEDFITFLKTQDDPKDPISVLAQEILPLVREGCERAEIARRHGLSRVTVSRALMHLRARATAWSSSTCGAQRAHHL